MAAIDPKLRKALTGISGILVTPFDDQDRIAPARLKPVIDRAVKAGVHILVAARRSSPVWAAASTTPARSRAHLAPRALPRSWCTSLLILSSHRAASSPTCSASPKPEAASR
jgi:hypothetical protein